MNNGVYIGNLRMEVRSFADKSWVFMVSIRARGTPKEQLEKTIANFKALNPKVQSAISAIVQSNLPAEQQLERLRELNS